MCSKSGVMDHKKFDSKNFSTVPHVHHHLITTDTIKAFKKPQIDLFRFGSSDPPILRVPKSVELFTLALKSLQIAGLVSVRGMQCVK